MYDIGKQTNKQITTTTTKEKKRIKKEKKIKETQQQQHQQQQKSKPIQASILSPTRAEQSEAT